MEVGADPVTARPGGRVPWGYLAAGGIATVSVVTIVVLVAGNHTPASDWAAIESRVRDVATRWTPTEGAWSRYGWNHPGPLPFYVLAVFYRLGGSDPDFLRVGALAIAAAAVAVSAVLLWRAGRAAFAIGGLALALAFHAAPTQVVTDYWNPSLAFVSTFLVVLASWAYLDGWRPALLVLAVSWSWVAQCHLSYGVILVPALAAGAAVGALRAWRDPGERRSLGVAVGVLALLWLPALLDSIVDPPGNLFRILRWAVQGDSGSAIGLGAATELVGHATDLGRLPWRPFRAFFTVLDPATGVLSGGLLVLLLAAGVAAWRRRLRSELRLVGLCAATWGWALFAVSRASGPLYYWIYWWAYSLVALTWLAVGLVAARLVAARMPASVKTGFTSVAAAVAALLLISAFVGSVPSRFYWEGRATGVVRSFADVTRRWLPSEPVAIEFAGAPEPAGAVHAGVVADLKRHGVDTVVAETSEPLFGRRHARADLARYPAVLVQQEMVFQDAPPGYTELAVDDPLTEAERTEVGDLISRLTQVFVEAGWESRIPFLGPPALMTLPDAPPAVVAETGAITRLAELASRGDRFVLYAREALG
jgi:hypothetical protein